MSLNEESRMVRPTLTDLYPVEFKYYSFVIRLGQCSESCNVLSSKTCVPKEAKHKCLGIQYITNKNEAKTMTIYISYDCKSKFNSTTCNSNQKWNNKTCQCESENY